MASKLPSFKEEALEEQGPLQTSIEAAGALEEATGFGAATNAGAKSAGKPAPSKTAGKQLRAGERAVEKGEEEAGKAAKEAAEGLAGEIGKIVLNTVLLLAGMVLVVYGIMVAVRPPEKAFSVPVIA